MNNVKTYKKLIIKKLKNLYFKKIFFAAIKAFLNLLSFASLILLILLIFENLFHFNSTIRTVLVYVFGAILVLFAGFYFVKIFVIELRIFYGANIYSLSDEVGKSFPNIQDTLKNTLQLINEKNELYSKELVEAEFKRIFNTVKSYNFNSIVKLKFKGKDYFKVLLILVLPVLIIFSDTYYRAFYSLEHYDKEFVQPPEYYFSVKPANATVSKGDSLSIKLKLIGPPGEIPRLFIKSTEDFEFNGFSMLQDSLMIFHKNFYALQNSFRYYFKVGATVSDTFVIKVIDRPIITNLIVSVKPPAYSKLRIFSYYDDGNINVLKGSLVNWRIKASKRLSKALIIFNGKEIKHLKIRGNIAYGSLKILGGNNYHFVIEDSNKIKNVNPIEYSINVEQDDYPNIELVAPTENVMLGADNLLNIRASISDDFGFSKLLLKYRISFSLVKKEGSKYKILKIPINKGVSEANIIYNWDLTNLALTEGDVVSFYMEIFDNDYVSGPKSAKTKSIAVKVPTLDELFKRVDTTQNAASNNLQKTLEEAENLKENLKNLNYELRKNKKKLEWSEKEKIQKTLKRFKNLLKKVEKIKQKIKKLQQDISKHKLLSKETIKKYEQLQKLFEEMDNKSLRRAFERMQRMLKSLMRENVQNEFRNIQFNEEAFRKSIERTIKLLKRIQIEEKLDEAIQRTKRAQNKQNKILKKLSEKLNESEKEKLSREEKRQGNNLKSLKRNLNELKNKMSELKDLPLKEIEKVIKKFEKEKNEKLSLQISSNIKEGKLSEATKGSKKVSQNLNELKKELGRIKKRMMRNNQITVMTKMFSIINNLLNLSKEEERLKNRTGKQSANSPKIDELARRQSSISNGLERVISQISSLSEKTFAITPEMGWSLSMAQSKMQSSINALENRMTFNAKQQQKQAMKYLNQTVAFMQGAMRNMMNPSSGGGGMSLMQQLQQLTRRQMEINQLTKALKQGKYTLEQLAQMQRLARQQEMIGKSLSKLNKEFQKAGESKKLTANLNDIVRNMQEIISSLKSNNIDDDLIRQQQNILSRMLDAQRSIYKRDFQKQRISTAGKQLKYVSPQNLQLNKNETIDKLREELMKAFRKGYSRDYRELIKKYFKILEKQKTFQK